MNSDLGVHLQHYSKFLFFFFSAVGYYSKFLFLFCSAAGLQEDDTLLLPAELPHPGMSFVIYNSHQNIRNHYMKY